MSIRTIIVDDEELARRGLEIRLQDERDVALAALCGVAATIGEPGERL